MTFGDRKLTPRQSQVYALIRDSGRSGITRRELAAHLGISLGGVSTLVGDIEMHLKPNGIESIGFPYHFRIPERATLPLDDRADND